MGPSCGDSGGLRALFPAVSRFFLLLRSLAPPTLKLGAGPNIELATPLDGVVTTGVDNALPAEDAATLAAAWSEGSLDRVLKNGLGDGAPALPLLPLEVLNWKARLLPVLGGDEAALDGVATEVGENTKVERFVVPSFFLPVVFSVLLFDGGFVEKVKGTGALFFVEGALLAKGPVAKVNGLGLLLLAPRLNLKGAALLVAVLVVFPPFGAAENSGMDADGSSVLLLISVPSRSRLFP